MFCRWKYSLRFHYLRRLRTKREIRAGILRNRGCESGDEKRRRVELSQICRTFILVAMTESHIVRYCFITEYTLPTSCRDCFALISQLNIQSLRHGRLARAILSQPGESKWYLCLRVIRVATIFPSPSRFMLVPLGNGMYSEASRG